MSDIEIITPPSLEQLAETANREFGLATSALEASVAHAILAGEALIAAKRVVPYGEWMAWLDANWQYTAVWAGSLMRLAAYADAVRSDGH